jgi:hypothetical protein
MRSQTITCREMDGVIGSHPDSLTLPREAARHIVKCGTCRRLAKALDEAHTNLEPSESRLRQIQAAINEDLRPVRPLASARAFLLEFMLISLAVVAVGSRLLGVNGWNTLSSLQRMTIFTALSAGIVLLAVSIVRQMAPGGRHSISPQLLPVGIPALLILVAAVIFQVRRESAFVSDGFACLITGLTYSIPASLLFCFPLSRGAVLYPQLTGAAAGGFAGLIGVSVLEVGCTNLDLYHILVWHLGVMLFCAVGGLSLGAAMEHVRRRRIPAGSEFEDS